MYSFTYMQTQISMEQQTMVVGLQHKQAVVHDQVRMSVQKIYMMCLHSMIKKKLRIFLVMKFIKLQVLFHTY